MEPTDVVIAKVVAEADVEAEVSDEVASDVVVCDVGVVEVS